MKIKLSLLLLLSFGFQWGLNAQDHMTWTKRDIIDQYLYIGQLEDMEIQFLDSLNHLEILMRDTGLSPFYRVSDSTPRKNIKTKLFYYFNESSECDSGVIYHYCNYCTAYKMNIVPRIYENKYRKIDSNNYLSRNWFYKSKSGLKSKVTKHIRLSINRIPNKENCTIVTMNFITLSRKEKKALLRKSTQPQTLL